MSSFIFSNFINTTASAALPSGGVTLQVSSSSNLPVLSAGQVLPIVMNDAATGLIYEVMYCTAISGSNLTVTRAQEGTTAQNWSIGDYVLGPPTAQSVAPVTSIVSHVVGNSRNLKSIVSAVSASATFTADEIIVETALGGTSYKLASFNKTINISGTGAGGMDTGANPTSTYIAVYAIYNPATQTASLLGTLANSAVAPNVYGGGNMPAGYTASALLSVWSINGSSQFTVGNQTDRTIFFSPVTELLSAGLTASQILTLTAPYNAKSIGGYITLTSSANQHVLLTMGNDTFGSGSQQIAAYCLSSNLISGDFSINLVTPKTIYWDTNVTAVTAGIYMTSYTI